MSGYNTLTLKLPDGSLDGVFKFPLSIVDPNMFKNRKPLLLSINYESEVYTGFLSSSTRVDENLYMFSGILAIILELYTEIRVNLELTDSNVVLTISPSGE